MRIYLKLTKNKKLIPFNYQSYLTGALHKWIGCENELHEGMSLYSFSWLQNVKTNNSGIGTTHDSYFFISGYEDRLVKRIIKSIIDDPSVCFGMEVTDVEIAEVPNFTNKHSFVAASPVFIKRRLDNQIKHIIYSNPQSKNYLTETDRKSVV